MANDAHDEIIVEQPGDKEEILKAEVEARIADALALREEQEELGEAPFWPLFDWDLLAWGPWQTVAPGDPGRIIFVGETAYLATAVFLSPAMAQNVAGFGGKIQLNYHTSNTQTMAATSLTRSVCIPAVAGQQFYVDVWKFEPTEAACLYETNICARICNCNNKTVPGYAAFVRHVYDFDPDHWRPAGWVFDHPIRFMVADPKVECDCP